LGGNIFVELAESLSINGDVLTDVLSSFLNRFKSQFIALVGEFFHLFKGSLGDRLDGSHPFFEESFHGHVVCLKLSHAIAEPCGNFLSVERGLEAEIV
jgi:hypothetical protein